MKKQLLLSLVALFTTLSICGQTKYGNVTMDELNMTTYEKDTTASAVVLSNIGFTRFRYDDRAGFQFETTVSVRIKILKSDGLDLCNVSVSYYELDYKNKEQITGLSGTTYNNENGKIVKTKLSKDYITDEQQENIKLKKFTMPGAKIGSVIEYKYTLVSDFYYYLRDFYFQKTSAPTLYAAYEIRIPEYFNFHVNQQGYSRISGDTKTVNESFSITYKDNNGRTAMDRVNCLAKEYKLEGHDIPALKYEPYVWTNKDYLDKISFELQSVQFPHSTIRNYSTTWAQIDQDILGKEKYGKYLNKKDLFKDVVKTDNVTLQYATEVQQIIKNKVKWNDKMGIYPEDLKESLKTGLGSSADMNFLLINALSTAGFQSFPVILSTRSNGRLPMTHPSIDAFNCVITGLQIGEETYYTDASNKFGDWNILPEECMVMQARKLMPSHGEWVDLSTISKGSDLILAQIKVEENSLNRIVKENLRGNKSLTFRNGYNSFKDEAEFIEKWSATVDMQIEDFKVEGLDQSGEIKTSYIAKSDFSRDDVVYISPMIEKHLSQNPFKEEKRTLPINFDFLLTYVQVCTIDIPEGYVVDELPKSEQYTFGENDISLIYKIVATGNKIQFQYKYVLNRLLFVAEEYNDLKNFFAKMVMKNSELIVLKKATQTENESPN